MNENQSELLQKAIAELKNSPTVDIKGKSYTQVSTRINIFRKYFPTASIETLITHNDDIRVIIQTKISIDNKVIATGYAEEIRGDGNYINQTSAVENCETSSIGRALSNLGLGGSEYASSFEVENAISQQQNNNRPQNNQQSYQDQNIQRGNQSFDRYEFQSLYNLGLDVVEQNGYLIVVGDNQYAYRDSIKALSFKFDPKSKSWYRQLNEQRAA
jgi:hypothetical protein